MFGGNNLRYNDIGAIVNYANAMDQGKKHADAFASSMNGTSYAAQQYVLNAQKANKSTKELVDGLAQVPKVSTLGAVGLKALSIAGNMIMFAAITKGIQLAVETVDNFIHRTERMAEAAKENADVYNTITKEVESLNKELDDTNSRIDELNKKPNLTFVEQEELERLKKTNEELERQLKLKQVDQNIAGVKARDSALEYINREETIGKYDGLRYNGYGSVELTHSDESVSGNQLVILQQQLIDYQKLTEDFKKVEAELDQIKLSNPNGYEDNVDYKIALGNYNFLDAIIKNMGESISSTNNTLNSFKSSLDETKDKDIIDFLNQLQDTYAELFNVETPDITSNFDELWDSSKFKSTRNEIEKLVQAGKFTPDVLNSNEKYRQLLDATGKSAEEVCAHIKALYDDIGKTPEVKTPFNKEEMISAINGMSEGFEELDKIYESIIDKDPFDFKLLDDDKFKKNFSELGDAYTDFVETVSSSPKDINACQSSFDNLVTEWLNSTGILQNVTDETANLTASMLKTMGVANAEEVVMSTLTWKHEQLAAEKYYNANASIALKDNTLAEYVAFLNEAEGAGISSQALAQLELAKIAVNNVKIDTASDIDQIIALANAAGASVSALSKLAQAKATFEGVASGAINVNDDRGVNQNKLKKAINTTTSIENGSFDFDFQQLDPSKYKTPVYGGGNKSAKTANGGGGGSKEKKAEKETKEYYDWIETLIDNISKRIEELQKKADNALRWQTKNKLQDTVYDQLTEKINTLEQAYNRYIEEANKSGLSADIIEKIQNGLIDIDKIITTGDANEVLVEQISNYQKWYDKAKSVKDEIVSVKEEQEEIAKIRLDNIIDDYDYIIEKLQKYADKEIGWFNQNQGQDKVITELKNQLNVLSQEYTRNIEKANSIALSDIYKRQIEDGSIDLTSITDDNVKELVIQYSKLFKNAQDCQDAISDVNDKIKEADELKLDNIINDYNQIVSLMEKYTEYRKNLIELRERQGVKSSTTQDYQKLIYDQNEIYSELEDKYDTLVNALNNSEVKEGSKKWYEMNEELKDIKSQMMDCANSVEDFKDRIIEIRFKPFDDLIQKLESVNSELSDTLSLLGDENLVKDGMLTDLGLSAVGLYGQQIINAKKQATEYANAIEALKKSYKNGDITLDEFNEKIYDYESAQRQAALATKDARDAIISLREEAIEQEIDAFNELIEKKKEALDAEKDLYEYQKKISEQSQNIAVLEKQIATLSLSTNREDIAQRLELEEKLKEAKEEAEDYQRDYSLEQQKEALDKEAQNYEQAKRNELENLKSNLDAQDVLIQQYLNQVKNNYSIVYDTLTEYANTYNMNVSESLTNPFSSAESATQSFVNVFADMVSEINYQLESINWSVFDRLSNLKKDIDDIDFNDDHYSGSDWSNDYDDITGDGKWHRAKDGKRWWFGENERADGNYWYAQGGYYNIGGKTYGFDNEGYMKTEWDDSQGDWHYFDVDSGEMQKNQWIKGKNKNWYYLGPDGVMVTDAAVKAKDGDGYYYVNDEGIWNESDGKLSKEQVDELELEKYAKGTKKAKRGYAQVNEHGYELMSTPKGDFIELHGGEQILNAEQRKLLYDFTKNPEGILGNILSSGLYNTGINDIMNIMNSNLHDSLGKDNIITRPGEVHVEMPIIVQGSVDERAVEIMENKLNHFVKYEMSSEINKAMKYSLGN